MEKLLEDTPVINLTNGYKTIIAVISLILLGALVWFGKIEISVDQFLSLISMLLGLGFLGVAHKIEKK